MKSNNMLAWGSAQIFFMLSVLVAVVFAILSNEIMQKLSLDASDLGLLGGVFFVTYAVSQLVLGILISRVRPDGYWGRPPSWRRWAPSTSASAKA
jgi:sugar phosphate permease